MKNKKKETTLKLNTETIQNLQQLMVDSGKLEQVKGGGDPQSTTYIPPVCS